jgi:hypothetical protein
MAVLHRIWFASFAILIMIACLGCSLGDAKEYLKGAITVNKMNNNDEIEAITFHFKDFPYDVSTGCHLSSENFDKGLSGPERIVVQDDKYVKEIIGLNDEKSLFTGEIRWMSRPIERSQYINELANFCSSEYFSGLARKNTTTAITFYPKIINGKTCTALEYTGLMGWNVLFYEYEHKPTNVVGLFMPLNETKKGCDEYLILASGNQTADWLDSVKVSKTK